MAIAEREVIQQRRTRIDKGQKKVTRRDLRVLQWIAEQEAVRIDHLAVLLGRESKRKNSALKISGVNTVVYRWIEQGWVSKFNPFMGVENPPFVYLTSKGLADLGIDFRPTEPSIRHLEHLHQVNRVRLFLESRRELRDMQWKSERVIRSEKALGKRRQEHVPDAEILTDGKVIAIEVELTRKTKNRLVSILDELTFHYPAGVWYFVEDSAEKSLANSLAKVGRKDLIKVRNLGEIPTWHQIQIQQR